MLGTTGGDMSDKVASTRSRRTRCALAVSAAVWLGAGALFWLGWTLVDSGYATPLWELISVPAWLDDEFNAMIVFLVPLLALALTGIGLIIAVMARRSPASVRQRRLLLAALLPYVLSSPLLLGGTEAAVRFAIAPLTPVYLIGYEIPLLALFMMTRGRRPSLPRGSALGALCAAGGFVCYTLLWVLLGGQTD